MHIQTIAQMSHDIVLMLRCDALHRIALFMNSVLNTSTHGSYVRAYSSFSHVHP